jgi:hypothetical protein
MFLKGSLALTAVVTAIMVLILKQDDFYVTPSYVLAKLYTNNLLMIFNSRLRIDHSRNGRPAEDPSFASFAARPNSLALGSFNISSNVQTDSNKFHQEEWLGRTASQSALSG